MHVARRYALAEAPSGPAEAIAVGESASLTDKDSRAAAKGNSRLYLMESVNA